MPNTKTHFPQIAVEIVKKIAEEQNGEPIEKKTPEQLRGPTKSEPNEKSSLQAKPEGENGEAL